VVEHRVRIDAPPEVVWEYWVDPRRICEWWGVDADLDPQPGGVMRVTLAVGGVMRGRYTTLEPPGRLVFRLGWDPAPGAPPVAPESSTVEVQFRSDAGGTLLVLRHTDLPEGAYEMHAAGWAHFIPMLAAAATQPTHGPGYRHDHDRTGGAQ
jgi:uncharacterized protein YndB with AHSA1/START domain